MLPSTSPMPRRDQALCSCLIKALDTKVGVDVQEAVDDGMYNGCAGGNGGADVEVPLWIKPSLCWTRSRVVVIESEGTRDDRDMGA